MTITDCPAPPESFDGHDYSQPPHTTPEQPRKVAGLVTGPSNCQAQLSDGTSGWCEHVQAYEVVVYQIGTHEWIEMAACFPCADTLKRRHQRWGPGGLPGVHSIRSKRSARTEHQ
jgi:hypothetical protein